MTPSVLRQPILETIYQLIKKISGRNFYQMREEIYRHFDENSPEVKVVLVKDVVHQMYMAYCLEFDRDDAKYPPGTTTWGKETRLISSIKTMDDFISRIDRHLLTAIMRGIKPKEIDLDVALRVLYGTTRNSKLRDHISGLVNTLQTQL